MNYGEELAYWYFRLNGFFPITNFVIHKSGQIHYTSDCDIIAVRPPKVYEDVGGQPQDWDVTLTKALDFTKTIGIICQVKTGRYDLRDIFKREYVAASVARLGFTSHDEANRLAQELARRPTIGAEDNCQFGKLLIAKKEAASEHFIFLSLEQQEAASEHFLFLSLEHVRRFIRERIQKYPKAKYRDRLFFGSLLIQDMIDVAALEVPETSSSDE
jgi:hypothetical protein